jgi:hypothetical protein
MERKVVPICYGDVASEFDGIPFTMWRERFPHGIAMSFGGCVTNEGSPTTDKRHVCQKCAEDAEAWRARQEKSGR